MIGCAMVMQLTACGSGNAPDEPTTGNMDTQQGTAGATADGELDIWAPYPETITITTVTSEYASATYPEGDDITNNVWTRAYKEKFNVDLVTEWVSDEYNTKINLQIAEGNLPDVFHVNSAQLQQLIDADMIWDLTDVFDTYASDLVKGYAAADPESFDAGKRDGRLYGMSQLNWGIIDQPDFVWIRKDWKEEQNLADPETMDDVVNICKTFMKAYGGYGMAVDQSLDYLNVLAVAWGAHPDVWIEDENGEIVYGSIQPEMKDAVAAWAEWYKEGILSTDFTTTDFSKMNEAVVSGNVGVQPFYQWWGYNPGVDLVSNLGTGAIFEPYLIPSANGEDVIHSITFPGDSYTVVSKTCKNPEAAVKLINYYGYMVDESTGVETPETISSFMDNDIKHTVGAFRILNPDSDYKEYENVSHALETGDTSGLISSGMWQKYNNSVDWKENGTPGSTGDYMQQGHDRCAFSQAKIVLDEGKYIKSKLWGLSPEALRDAGSTLDDILTEGFTKIIIGEEPIDYFDTVVTNWKQAGGDQATAQMNEVYGTN